MLLNPFVALEERTLGRWPTFTLLIADDVVADADNFIRLEAGFEKVDGCKSAFRLWNCLDLLNDELAGR